MSRRFQLGAVAVALAISASALTVGGLPGARAAGSSPHAAAAGSDQTSALERKRVDSVPTPKLGWYPCQPYAECASVKLPLDYDSPKGATTEVTLLRVKAKNQAKKIGTLFLNPGGPGGSGVQMALAAPYFLSPAVLERFDVVGFDPRGTNFSDNVKCFTGYDKQYAALSKLTRPFPYGAAEEATYVSVGKTIGKGCSTVGRPLSAAMSTAEVARDMDVLRRAVGDKQLTYLGFSYGSYLGQVYANLFPDRVRALALDGVVDPLAWAGSAATRQNSVWDRIHSADGALKALNEIFARCSTAGRDQDGALKCGMAVDGHPAASFDAVAEYLKKSPLVDVDPYTGVTSTLGYSEFIATMLSALYDPAGYFYVDGITSELIAIVKSAKVKSTTTRVGARATTAARKASWKRVMGLRHKLTDSAAPQRRPVAGLPYDNGLEALFGVSCTDSLEPANAESWPALAAAADKRAKYFGRLWAWNDVACATKTWTAQDEDAYRGPFTKRTVNPLLFVGNIWDPATNYNSAVRAAGLAPNARLLTSYSWGHTAYQSSPCAAAVVDTYLLTKGLPPRGTACIGDDQPFEDSADQSDSITKRSAVKQREVKRAAAQVVR